jgi:hypothetical protein
MKLCKDCRWADCQGESPVTQYWECRHSSSPRPPLIDYVTGISKEPRLRAYYVMRDDRDLCGPEGRYWEAKEE